MPSFFFGGGIWNSSLSSQHPDTCIDTPTTDVAAHVHRCSVSPRKYSHSVSLNSPLVAASEH